MMLHVAYSMYDVTCDSMYEVTCGICCTRVCSGQPRLFVGFAYHTCDVISGWGQYASLGMHLRCMLWEEP